MNTYKIRDFNISLIRDERTFSKSYCFGGIAEIDLDIEIDGIDEDNEHIWIVDDATLTIQKTNDGKWDKENAVIKLERSGVFEGMENGHVLDIKLLKGFDEALNGDFDNSDQFLDYIISRLEKSVNLQTLLKSFSKIEISEKEFFVNDHITGGKIARDVKVYKSEYFTYCIYDNGKTMLEQNKSIICPTDFDGYILSRWRTAKYFECFIEG